MDLLDAPHHDGSERHVGCSAPDVGDEVSLRVRVPVAAGVRRVLARHTPDGEGELVEARIDRRDATASWWRVTLPVRGTELSYRFLLESDGGYRWLTQQGITAHDPTDATDFRISTASPVPAWAADAVAYEVFCDRFARSAEHDHPRPSWALPAAWDDPVIRGGEDAMRQHYGGDLDGLRERLDHLQRLGVDLVWTTPFFTAPSNHRYNASTFDAVDPALGGDEALRRLLDALHARGMRLIGDLTPNHTGDQHPWFRRAQADPSAPEAGFYVFTDHPDGYWSWLGVPTLPKLDHRSEVLRRRLWDGEGSVVARWLHRGLDGWRIDVANMVGRLGPVDDNLEVARGMRRTVEAARGDALLIGEHGFDPTPALAGDAWHGVMSYAQFTRPAWCWLRQPEPLVDPSTGREVEFLGMPLPIPRVAGATAVATMRAFAAAIPWRSTAANLTLLGSHDTARVRTVTGSRERQLAALGLQVALPGLPTIFAGDELGLVGWDSEDARRPVPWDRQRWDTATLEGYRHLLAVRRRHRALRHGGVRWAHIGDDALVLLRETADDEETVLVQVRRDSGDPVVLDARRLGAAHLAAADGGGDVGVVDGRLELPADGPGARFWHVASRR